MKLKVIIGLIAFFCFQSSWSQNINQKDSKGKKTGLWVNKYENDTVKSTGYYKDGKQIGLWKFYYEDGSLRAYLEHLSDGKTSNFKLFELGVRIAEGLYLNGKKDGKWYYYDKDSVKIKEEVYKNGIKDGLETTFYLGSGKVFQSCTFKNGKKEGPFKQFFESGILKSDMSYTNDTVVGKVIYYHHTGKKLMEGSYYQGVRNGDFFMYDEQGKLTETIHYKMGKMDEAALKRRMSGEIKTVIPEDVIYEDFPGTNPNGN